MDEDLELVAGSHGISVHTGFPNPALERLEQGAPLALDINRLLIRSPNSTYLFRISGHGWASAGIYDGDVAVIDRALVAQLTDMVIVWQASGFALRRQTDILPDETPWGVITATIHQLRPL